MKYFYLIFILIIAFSTSYSQKIEFGLQTGVGFYKMTDLKEQNNSVKRTPGAKVVSDYPPSLYYRPSIIFRFNSFNLGFLYSLHKDRTMNWMQPRNMQLKRVRIFLRIVAGMVYV